MKISSIYILICIALAISKVTTKSRVTTDATLKICWNSTSPTGSVNGHSYQLVILEQRNTLVELECNYWCDFTYFSYQN